VTDTPQKIAILRENGFAYVDADSPEGRAVLARAKPKRTSCGNTIEAAVRILFLAAVTTVIATVGLAIVAWAVMILF